MAETAPHPTVKKSWRRWLQFRLRTLLILTALFALWLGLKADRVNRQRRAVEALGKMGVQIRYDYEVEPNPRGFGFQYNPDLQPPGPEWLRELLGEHYFITPVWLSINDQDAIDRGCLTYLDRLPDLEQVSLGPMVNREMNLRDSDLAHLKHLTRVRMLHFGRCWGALSGHDTPRDFGFLSKCRRLEWLSADHSPFDDAALAHLKRARNLRQLLLSDTLVGDDGLAHLKGLPKLELLELTRTQVTDAGLAHLASLKSLTYVGLNENNVTDAGLEHLRALTNLTRLGLSGTRVTEKGVKDLQSALPKCRIETDHLRRSPLK
jgi:hypothetical protein